jgi:tRNA-binding EMAP/Myf-like protein
MINVIQNTIGFCFPMNQKQILFNPSHKMILERSFDNLVENIWCDEFMYIGAWKIICEWLKSHLKLIEKEGQWQGLTITSEIIPY